MLPSGELYVYGLERADARMSYRCRTQHRFDGAGGQRQQLSANAASVTVAEPLSNAAPTIASKVPLVQIDVDGTASIPCLAQGFPVPEIRFARFTLSFIKGSYQGA